MKAFKLGDICDMNSGGTPRRGVSGYYDGSIKWAKISDIEAAENGLISETEETITPEGLASINNRIFPENTLLLAMYGSVGKTAITTTKMSTNQAILGIRPKNGNIDLQYLKYWFETIKRKLLDRAVGGTLQNISLTIVKDLEIPLPPLPQQQKIVAILDKADSLRQKDRQLLKLYQDLIDSVFNERFKSESNLVSLSELCSKITDGVHARPVYVTDGVPFISVKNVTTKKLKFTNCMFITEKDHTLFYKRCNPELGDILYTKVGATYGRAAIVNTNRQFSLYVSVALLKPKKEIVDSNYLYEVLNTSYVKRQADRSVKGAGVPDLHLIEIKGFKIPLPSLENQKEFAGIALKIEEQIDKVSEQIIGSDNLFNCLLQRAFNETFMKGQEV